MLSVQPLSALFARSRELRGPFTLSEGSSSFDAHREAAERHLAEKLSVVENAFVQRALMLQAQQRIHA
eukprot:5993042-Prymnesium_polylepis.1